MAAIPSLAQETNRTALLHMKSGEVKEFNVSDLDSITFSEPVTYDKVVTGKYGLGVYFGGGEYYTLLSDDSLKADGSPTKTGQTIVTFYAFGDKSLTPVNAILPSGRYVSDSSYGLGTLYQNDDYLNAFFSITDSTGHYIPFDLGAEANVEYKSDGTYTIDFKGRSSSSDTPFKNLHMTFNGKINYINRDDSYYVTYDHDVDFVPNNLSAGCSASSDYSDYSCTFYTVPLDDQGFVTGAGTIVNLELLAKGNSAMNLDDLVGTYTFTDPINGPYEPGHFIGGTNYEMYGQYICIGTYINEYDDQGQSTQSKDFATGGTITVSKVDDKYRFVCDLTLEGGHKLTMDYTASADQFIDRGSSDGVAKKAMVQSRKGFSNNAVKSQKFFTKINKVRK